MVRGSALRVHVTIAVDSLAVDSQNKDDDGDSGYSSVRVNRTPKSPLSSLHLVKPPELEETLELGLELLGHWDV